MAVATAVNIDGGRRQPEFKGGRKWRYDDRLAEEQQVGDKDEVYGLVTNLDRGHMVRREDPVWGSPEEAGRANCETYILVNAVPQHSKLNRDMKSWRAVEEHIQREVARDHRLLSVFTGPIFSEGDPPVGKVLVPLDFWKVIVTVRSSAELHATAFRFSQAQFLRREALEEVPSDSWLQRIRAQQKSVASIGTATGLDFGALVDADSLARRALVDEADPTVDLTLVEDIVL